MEKLQKKVLKLGKWISLLSVPVELQMCPGEAPPDHNTGDSATPSRSSQQSQLTHSQEQSPSRGHFPATEFDVVCDTATDNRNIQKTPRDLVRPEYRAS